MTVLEGGNKVIIVVELVYVLEGVQPQQAVVVENYHVVESNYCHLIDEI
jgi:hypothetical protein